MSELTAAISWSGPNVVLSLFVVWSTTHQGDISAPHASTRPALMRAYDLEDESDSLAGRATSEMDLIFDDVPHDLDHLIEAWLTSSIQAGGVVAWFGFVAIHRELTCVAAARARPCVGASVRAAPASCRN